MESTIGIAQKRLRVLADGWREHSWYEPLTTKAPGPIAHEIAAFATVAETGDAGGALLQLRDTVETIVKFSTLAFACETISSGDADLVRRSLFQPNLSLGTWAAIASKLASGIKKNDDAVTHSLAQLFTEKQFKASISEFIKERNKEIGHGAFRFDPIERIEVVENIANNQKFTATLIGSLATLNWPTMFVRKDDASEELMMGFNSIRDWHDTNQPVDDHPVTPLTCFLQMGGKELSLTPYIMARRCGKCEHQDIFLYDGTRFGRKSRPFKFDFIDYVQGHKYRDLDDVLSTEIGDQIEAIQESHINAVSAGLKDQTAIQELENAVNKLTRFMRPDHLLDPLEQTILNNRTSVTWLQAPAHIGKSTLARSISDQQFEYFEELNIPELLTVGIFIQRYWRSDFRLFGNQLRWELRRAVNLADQEFDRIPMLSAEGDNPTQNFLDVIEAARNANPIKANAPLLIVIDGLDELSATQEAMGLLDCIPCVEELPDGVHLLLTSRLLDEDDCPAWLGERLGERLKGHSTWI